MHDPKRNYMGVSRYSHREVMTAKPWQPLGIYPPGNSATSLLFIAPLVVGGNALPVPDFAVQ